MYFFNYRNQPQNKAKDQNGKKTKKSSASQNPGVTNNTRRKWPKPKCSLM